MYSDVSPLISCSDKRCSLALYDHARRDARIHAAGAGAGGDPGAGGGGQLARGHLARRGRHHGRVRPDDRHHQVRAARARTRADCDWFIFRDSLPDVHILNVAVGATPELDHANTVLMKCTDQVDLVCKLLQVGPGQPGHCQQLRFIILSPGRSAYVSRVQCCGYFPGRPPPQVGTAHRTTPHNTPVCCRGLAERCPVPMKTLITFGSPHQGQFGVPDCREATHSPLLCELVRQLISQGEEVSSTRE